MDYTYAISTHRPQSDSAEGSRNYMLLQDRQGHSAGMSWGAETRLQCTRPAKDAQPNITAHQCISQKHILD